VIQQQDLIMVQELERKRQSASFPESAPAANPVFFRTYSRRTDAGLRESWNEVCDRTLKGLVELGKLSREEAAILDKMQRNMRALPSGRWLWVGGTNWLTKPKNFSGAYNCTSTNLLDWKAFGLMMDLAMMGCGTGAVIEPQYIKKLPIIRNRLNITVKSEIGSTPKEQRREFTQTHIEANTATIYVGDSREGWVESYQTLLELSSDERFTGEVQVFVDISDVRQSGETLKGFGGMANPVKLPGLYQRCASILNKALGRQLNSVECCLLIDEAAVTIVAGNIRRCLPEDALVHTSKGLVPIRDVQVGDLVQTPLGFRRVVDKFDQGFQDVYEIETNATYPRATLNHKQAVLADAKGEVNWKSVASLVEGDRLLHNIQILPGTVTHLPADLTESSPSQSRTIKSLLVPDLTPEVAWLIGLTHGDGYVALGRNKYDKPYGHVQWSVNSLQIEQTEIIQAKIDSALALFGLTATHSVTKGENTAKSICSSIRLAEYFHGYIKQPNVPLIIPSFILQGSVDIRSAYLAGLIDSNGAVNNRLPHLVTSVYRSFIRQVGTVLSSLGMAARTTTSCPEKQEWQVKYNLTLPALKHYYNALIAPHSVKGELPQGLKMYGFTVPGAMMCEAYTYSEMREMGFQGSCTVDANYERYIAEADISLDIAVTVKGLGSYDHVQTYDIEVEEAHCFYCDGYLTHNSAGMRQFVAEDEQGATAKDNLWQQDTEGNWRIDSERDSLRMANHTRVFHRKPTLEESIGAVRKQYYSGEGAIQWAGEAVARANADLLNTPELKTEFLQAYEQGKAQDWIKEYYPEIDPDELEHRIGRFGLNPCGEIVGSNFHCNLSEVHLNQLDPDNYKEQEEAFTAGALSVAALLNHKFQEPRYQYSRELDPIVGVSFTGLFDFFVHAFGVDWLCWWEQGRPETPGGMVFKRGEQKYLSKWREIVHKAVWEYCDKHNIKCPNRCTTVQPSGCLDRTALRIFDQGLLYADEILNPGSGETVKLNLSVRKGIPISTGIANQPLQLIKVTLRNGRILRMTANHRLSINGSWVYAADMTPGMKIDFSIGEYKNQQDASLLNIDQFQYTREGRQLELGHSPGITATMIKTPKTMSPDLSYFIGALFGDGCLSPYKHHIRFCRNDYALVQRLQQIGEELFGLQGQIRKYSNREAFELSFASVQLFNWLQLNGLAKIQESQSLERIPLAIRCSSQATILSFFCGLIDTDGCIRSTGRMSIDSASEKFLRNLQEIGEAVGLCFSIFHNTQGENKQGQKDMWGLCLSRMLSQPDALAYLNKNTQKAKARPIPSAKRSFKFEPYTVKSVEWEETPDYSYDFAVEGIDDNDSWYWQGGIKSHNTKSLLTGASSGWHPPKAQRFIRRITFRKNDPVALACIDYGYNVIPSQSDKDENGNLLNDPFDPSCTEWLVEIPVAVSWADLPGADVIDVSKFSALAQLDFVMQVQKFYTSHNTSATLELRSEEVEPLGKRIYEAIQNDEGYISAALLARFDDLQSFPRLPFEPIDKSTYQRLSQEVKARRKTDDFCAALSRYDLGEMMEVGPSGCDSDKCMFPDQPPTS
jgi:ribonucleotide reductase class II